MNQLLQLDVLIAALQVDSRANSIVNHHSGHVWALQMGINSTRAPNTPASMNFMPAFSSLTNLLRKIMGNVGI